MKTRKTAQRIDSISFDEFLQMPYSWNFVPQADGAWVGEIREIHGCYTQGTTYLETFNKLTRLAEELLALYRERGEELPPPLESDFSGNIALRLPKELHRRASLHASQNGTSLNQFIGTAVAAAVGAHDYHLELIRQIYRVSLAYDVSVNNINQILIDIPIIETTTKGKQISFTPKEETHNA